MSAIEKSAFLVLSSAASELEGELKGFLLENAFDNKYTVHPRRFAEMSREECAALLECLERGDRDGAGERGRKLAAEGVGVKIALGIASRLRLFGARALLGSGKDGLLPALEALDSCSSGFLEGFMEGYEAKLLLEQERIRKALAAAQAGASERAGERPQ